jgi:osmoprotectant transport system ATP-binding protein
MIRFEKVSKRFAGTGAAVVKDLNLHIETGKICMLVGPSGCGKTTIMKMINKLVTPSSGRIYLDGLNIGTLDTIQLRLNIGYVIQEIGLFPHMSVAENVATVPAELGWTKARIANRVDELLSLVDLDPAQFRSKRPRELSGGQQQRVGIARALAADPAVLLMDEPFGALDPITRARLQDEVLDIQSRLGKTIVFVSHDMDEALKMGDRIAVFRGGRLLQCGTPHAIVLSPADPFVSELIGGRKALKLISLISCHQIMTGLDAADGEGDDMAGLGHIAAKASAQDALAEMLRTDRRRLLADDDLGQAIGVVRLDDIFKCVATDA